jgi:hypothetical protein
MDMESKDRWIKALTAGACVVMVTVNALANALPINGIGTGALSDAYPNLFAPAGLTFAIWGVIYLMLGVFTLYLLGLFRVPAGAADSATGGALLRRVSILFAISSIANAAWIFSWHYRAIPLSMLLMLGILACLILINRANHAVALSTREKALVRVPFAVYFGWITVATIANATTLLVALGWNGLGLTTTVWTVAVLVAGVAIGAVTLIRLRDLAYGLVLVWAYVGILIRHISVFKADYPAVIATVIGSLVAFMVALAYVLVGSRWPTAEDTAAEASATED